MTLDTPISDITSIGGKVAPGLKKLGLVTAQDLLFYWPHRYEDWSKVKAIAELVPGEQVTTKGVIELIQNKRSRWKKRMITEAIIADETGKTRAVWFSQPYLLKNLKPGDEVYISGRLEMSDSGPQFTHPVYEKITRSKAEPTHTARIVPMYPLTKGVSQKQLRYLISQVLKIASQVSEWLPVDIANKYKLQAPAVSLQEMHFPTNRANLREAQHRFKFEELFLLQLRAQVARQILASRQSFKIEFKERETRQFVEALPFQLTKAQKVSAWEILGDLQKNVPMNRLLEGDVGSGKTVVAALAAYNTMLNKLQVAYLAPTEVLAAQQYENLSKLFAGHGFKIALLTSSQQRLSPSYEGGDKGEVNSEADLPPAPSLVRRGRILDELAVGNIDFIIGTHALIQERVKFDNLALAIIDEQHRFGVSQRAALIRNSQAGSVPHLLSMTATPIPRSLALTVYGELDLSIIDELPSGREPIETKIIAPDKRSEHYRFIESEIKKGRQAFIVCPLIDPSDKLGKKAVAEEYEKLSREVFPHLRIGLLHGKLKPQEKEKVMTEFSDGKIDILVSTPVVEVGIDVPNSTVMMIESAERFGLAQLHQFRGRVGRGKHKSYCFLFTESATQSSLERLHALVESQDGFKLAERDLEFRGPGEVYGVKQHGFDDILKVAKLTDYIVIKEAHQAATALIKASPDLSKFAKVKEKLDIFEQNIHLE